MLLFHRLLVPARAFASMSAKSEGPIAQSMLRKLEATLNPIHVKLVNDSSKHASHYADDGSAAAAASETHFRLEVVSDKFGTLSQVQRHRLVYDLLKEEFAQGLHALSMTTRTPAEQEKAQASSAR